MKLESKTKTAMAGIDWAIGEILDAPQKDDEFTIDELIEKSKTPDSHSAIYSKLKRMVQAKKLETRVIRLNGTRTRIYRKP